MNGLRRLRLGALLLLVAGGAAWAQPEPLRVMTFNIRYATDRDGLNAWPMRQEMVPAVLRIHRPDVCGLQEALSSQLTAFRLHAPGYAWYSVGRDGGDRGEHCAIGYLEARFERLDAGTFWLSETPDAVEPGFGAQLRRICSWVHLKFKDREQTVYVFNTHFDHATPAARIGGAALIRERIAALGPDASVVLLGDLNALPASRPITILSQQDDGEDTPLLRDGFEHAEFGHFGPVGTFKGFGRAEQDGQRIDYIFAGRKVRILQHVILNDTGLGGRTPSDHRAVFADLQVGGTALPQALELQHAWRFHPDPEDNGLKLGFARADFDDSQWERHTAGEPWEAQGHEGYDGVGWYRKRISVPADWESPAFRGQVLLFEAHGIADAFQLFINEQKIAEVGTLDGSRWNQRTAIQISPESLRYAESNTIALRVVDRRRLGGLVGRPVRLRLVPRPIASIVPERDRPTHLGQGLISFRAVDALELDAVRPNVFRNHFRVRKSARSPLTWIRLHVRCHGGEKATNFRVKTAKGEDILVSALTPDSERHFELVVEDSTLFWLEDPVLLEGRLRVNVDCVRLDIP